MFADEREIPRCRLLTAVAGRSSVAAVGAVAMEGAPRLSAPPPVFAVTGRAPERETDTDTDTDSLSRVITKKKSFSRINLKPSAYATVLASRCLGENPTKSLLLKQKEVWLF